MRALVHRHLVDVDDASREIQASIDGFRYRSPKFESQLPDDVFLLQQRVQESCELLQTLQQHPADDGRLTERCFALVEIILSLFQL